MNISEERELLLLRSESLRIDKWMPCSKSSMAHEGFERYSKNTKILLGQIVPVISRMNKNDVPDRGVLLFCDNDGYVLYSQRGSLSDKSFNGTLILDEIGEMLQEMQVKLLRAIQEKKNVEINKLKPRIQVGKEAIEKILNLLAGINVRWHWSWKLEGIRCPIKLRSIKYINSLHV